MVAAAGINFSIGFVLLVLILFRVGDVQAAIGAPTGQPYIAILLDATGSVDGTSILIAYIIVALIFCSTNVVTTSSRQLFSFEVCRSPDGFRGCQTGILLSLILIGSSTAFNNIASLFGVALMGSYIVSISTLVYQRLKGGNLPRTRFSLGRVGIYVNLVSIAFDAFVFVVVRTFPWFVTLDADLCCSKTFFPPAPDPDPASMNWACLIFGAAVIFALGFYRLSSYTAPVESVRPEEDLVQVNVENEGSEKGIARVHDC
ncbi:uncharacterized protein LTR77_009402 [Saxophila tyrrhenica]|uniref:Uncharacterized protein n=1 Tax=Saxophila tyrrhenica TaxID=1690608 RepID=A0AAV9P0A4_9PEZI|nr:hypothetical protein LTR77_009402 [Saxophila tyrrhenica]